MKKTILLIALLFCSFYTFAQLGKTKQETIALFGKEQILKESSSKPGYSGVLFKLDTLSFVQATFKGDKAVMLSYIHADSLLSEVHYQKYLGQNLPQFKVQQQCSVGDKTYLLNAQKNQLVVQNHAGTAGAFPLIGVTLVGDPAIINSMSEKIRRFCK